MPKKNSLCVAESIHGNQITSIYVEFEADSVEDLDGISYEEIKVMFYVNHKFMAEISDALDKAGLLTKLIDDNQENFIELVKNNTK